MTQTLHIPQEAIVSHFAMLEPVPNVPYRQIHSVTKAYIASQAFGEIFQPNLFMAAKHMFIVVHLGTHLSVKPEW